jgi:2-oxoisovalerate dehydrogenase E1 component
MPCGGGTGLFIQTNEAWYTKPRFKSLSSLPYDAKGLLNEAINDPNLHCFFEQQLYRSVYQDVPKIIILYH